MASVSLITLGLGRVPGLEHLDEWNVEAYQRGYSIELLIDIELHEVALLTLHTPVFRALVDYEPVDVRFVGEPYPIRVRGRIFVRLLIVS